MSTRPAIFALSDGSVFFGKSRGYGKAGDYRMGEVIFNTAMTGYQEIISDPSYSGQIINFTHPHIGNTGANGLDDESPRVLAAGVVMRQMSAQQQHWRATASLEDYLRERQVIAIDGIDTRAVTRAIRQQGALGGCLMVVDAHDDADTVAASISHAQAFAGLQGAGLAEEASGTQPQAWTSGAWDADSNSYADAKRDADATAPHVIILDCGVKHNILRSLTARGCRVSVHPYQSSAKEILSANPDGILISNGPGDPEACETMVKNVRAWLAARIPLFGLCLGHQIIAHALGAQTTKMKFGHHGANHPVRDASGRVIITSQNHGFAVAGKSLPAQVQLTHVSLFDGSVQGMQSTNPPLLTFQGHPEASPGPHEASALFDDFIQLIRNNKSDNA